MANRANIPTAAVIQEKADMDHRLRETSEGAPSRPVLVGVVLEVGGLKGRCRGADALTAVMTPVFFVWPLPLLLLLWAVPFFHVRPLAAPLLLVAEVGKVGVSARSTILVLGTSDSPEDSEPPSADPDERVFMGKGSAIPRRSEARQGTDCLLQQVSHCRACKAARGSECCGSEMGEILESHIQGGRDGRTPS